MDKLRTGLLSDGTHTYTYDHANRLTQVVSGTLTTGFIYPSTLLRAGDGAGDRVTKTVDGVETRYTLDPAAGLTQVLQEATAGQTTSYLYGHDLLAQYDSGTWAYHVNDGLGSVRQLADPAGQVVAGYSFSPFGVPLGESGGEPYGFTGEQWDASAGLVYLRARMYNPQVGRFLTRDPWQGDLLWPQTLNGYSYVLNNPINATDPGGQISAHRVVQVWYAFQYGLIPEYRIPGTEPDWMPDWAKRRGWWWGSRVDLLDPINFEIYEVESVETACAPGHGLDQVWRYITELNAAHAYFVNAWRPGTRATRQMRVFWTPVYDLIADLEGPGLIVYRFEPNAQRVKILVEITCFSWLARLMYEGVKGLEGLTPEPAMGPPILMPRFLIDLTSPLWDPWKKPPPIEA